MTSLLAGWFESEAAGCLDRIEAVRNETTTISQAQVQRDVRTLGGVARLAGRDRLQAAATSISRALSEPVPPDELRQRLMESLADLRALVTAAGDDEALEHHVDAIRTSWLEEPRPTQAQATDDAAFLDWVALEAADIAATMDRGVSAFTDDPEDRDSLATILRRQRALLGAARLPTVPVVGETLQAVEDLTNLIVRLNVPVKTEWLDVFRCARDVLRSSAAALEDGNLPEPINALSRLRTLREELVDRYGPRIPEPASPAAASWPETGRAPAVTPPETSPAPHTLSPLERALALRSAIEAGAAPSARAALDELYALLRKVLA